MSNNEQEPPADAAQHASEKRRPLFGPNRSGFGFHPYRWEGWLIIVVIVAAIVTVVVLFRTGVL
jgi:hypothetical protein